MANKRSRVSRVMNPLDRRLAGLGLLLEDLDDFLDGMALVSGRNLNTNPIATTERTAKDTITQASPHAFCQAGNASIRAKLATQSTAAAIAAARPRTEVGKTSPWISQPVPPTPIANEVMKNEKPTMTTTVLGMSVRNATPAAANRMNTAMPAYPPMASGRRPCLSIQRKAK